MPKSRDEETTESESTLLELVKDRSSWGERLVVPEWEDDAYRRANGWKGTDLVHSGTL